MKNAVDNSDIKKVEEPRAQLIASVGGLTDLPPLIMTVDSVDKKQNGKGSQNIKNPGKFNIP